MAAALQFLQENGLTDYDTLAEKTETEVDRAHTLAGELRAVEDQLAQTSALMGAVVDYAKTLPVFDGYKAARYSKKYLAAHEEELDTYRAAKASMFNFCNRICREIEIPQKPGNKYEYKIDMSMAIYLCKKFFRESDFSGEKLVQDIKRYVQPIRPNRADKRNLKVKSFPGFPYRIPS